MFVLTPHPTDPASGPDTVHSVCPHDCPSTCALDVERLDAHRIGIVRGAADNDYTAGVVCAKVGRYADRVHHPHRLKQPMRRMGPKGEATLEDWSAFAPISWDEALDEIASRLVEAADRDGSEAVWPYYYAGTMGLTQRDGINRLRNVMRYSRELTTICTSLADAGQYAGVGAKYGPDPRELAKTDLAIVWGGNPVHTQVHVMTHIARARKRRGAKLVVVDPYRTATAQAADWHVCLRPGTDGALACGVMHVLFRDGMADRDYMADYADKPEALEAHLRTRTPRWASEITGVPEADIERLAHMIGRTPRTFIRIGYGLSRSRNGAAQVHSVTCIATVAGLWKHEGGGSLYGNAQLYANLDRSLIDGSDALDKSIRLLDQSRIGPILTGDPSDLGDGPPVTALFVQNTNPMVVCPDSLAVRRGFARDDLFVCVHEQFMTETAAMADIVLPATTFLEHDDIYTGGGHLYLMLARRVIEPLAEAKPNHWVICELAKRLGAEHRGFHMTEWEIIDETLRRSGFPDAQTAYEMRWIDCSKSFEESHFLNGFPTGDGKFHFAPDWSRVGRDGHRMPRLPDHFDIIDNTDGDRPFRLVTAPARSYLNTSFTETDSSRKREKRPTALVHPEDCAAMGVGEGDRIRLGNERAEVIVHVKPFDGLQPGVIVVESIWPNRDFEGGVGINALVSAEAGPPKGGAAFHDTAIWAHKADENSIPIAAE